MQNVTALGNNTPLSRLFVAINHYISTGDHIGEGNAIPEGPSISRTGEPHPADKIRIILLVNTTDKADLSDFEKFKSRFSQVAKDFNTKLESGGRERHFLVYTFVIKYGFCNELAQKLTEQPGPLGWGSMKELIEKHFPG